MLTGTENIQQRTNVLPPDLIDYILYHDWYIGEYPGLVKLLEDHAVGSNYRLRYDHAYQLGQRFHVSLYENQRCLDEWIEHDRRCAERVERQCAIDKAQQERKHRWINSPIMQELRVAIETENWTRVLEIKQIFKSAEEEYDWINIEQLKQQARRTKAQAESQEAQSPDAP